VHKHVSRRASAVQGLKMLNKLKRHQVQPEHPACEESHSSDGSCSEDSGSDSSSEEGDKGSGREEDKSDGSSRDARAVKVTRAEPVRTAAPMPAGAAAPVQTFQIPEDDEVDAFFDQLELDSDEE
jgi:hypothetical protein